MLYEIRDPLLGAGTVVHLTVLAPRSLEGVLLHATLEASGPVREQVELVWGYGGVNGQRGVRDGDIGTESVPISQYFQLQPEFCRNNAFAIDRKAATFTLATALTLVWEGDDPLAGRDPPDLRTAATGTLEPVDFGRFFNDRVTEIFRPGKYRSPRSPYVSLAIPAQGIGGWAGHVNAMATIDDSGLRAAARSNGGRFVLPNGVPFITPADPDASNVVFTSHWDNYPVEATVPLGGRARYVYLLMTGTTNHMQSRFDNGEVVVTYDDGTSGTLTLHNPTNWWPIEQDYFIDDFQFRRPGPIPPRVDLKTGRVRLEDEETFKGKGGPIPGGAATVLGLHLDPARDPRSLTLRAVANEVVIGLMAATLVR